MPVSKKRRKSGKPTKGSDKLVQARVARQEVTAAQRLATKELQKLIKEHGVDSVRNVLQESVQEG